jgi:hypothetical protein
VIRLLVDVVVSKAFLPGLGGFATQEPGGGDGCDEGGSGEQWFNPERRSDEG